MEKVMRNLIKNKEEDIRKVLKDKLEVQKKVNEEGKGFRDECFKLKQEIVGADCVKQVLITKIKEYSKFVREISGGEGRAQDFKEINSHKLGFIEKVRKKIRVETIAKKELKTEVERLRNERELLKQQVKSLKEKQQFFQDTCEDNLEWLRTRNKRRVSASSIRYQTYINPNYYITQLSVSKG